MAWTTRRPSSRRRIAHRSGSRQPRVRQGNGRIPRNPIGSSIAAASRWSTRKPRPRSATRRSTWAPRACSRPASLPIIELTSVTREVGVGDKLVPAGKPADTDLCAARAVCDDPRSGHRALWRPRAACRGRPSAPSSRSTAASPRASKPATCSRCTGLGATVGAAEGSKYGWTSKEGSDLKLPNERYGLAFVFRVFDRVSYALVMQASRPVNLNDVVQNP